jgi:hypothetical protein
MMTVVYGLSWTALSLDEELAERGFKSRSMVL